MPPNLRLISCLSIAEEGFLQDRQHCKVDDPLFLRQSFRAEATVPFRDEIHHQKALIQRSAAIFHEYSFFLLDSWEIASKIHRCAITLRVLVNETVAEIISMI
jgi:hypothetical protein